MHNICSRTLSAAIWQSRHMHACTAGLFLQNHLHLLARCLSLTPAPYEKAQASYVICKRAAHPDSGLNQKECRVGRACVHACMYVCMHASMYVCMHTFERRMYARKQ